MESYYKYRLMWDGVNGKSHTKLFNTQGEAYKFIQGQKTLSSDHFSMCSIRKEG